MLESFEEPGGPAITVVLTTDGGYVEVVQRIVETLRYHYQEVNFIIPNHAFSAGTILAMSGDNIYMDYYSRLGPIDPQVQSTKGQMVPALGYLVQWERLIDKAKNDTITLAEIQLMIEGFDQAELYQYEQARELSVDLLKKWLAQYKFRRWKKTETRGEEVDDARRTARAEEIARALNDSKRWRSHGYGISMDILQNELQLRIEDFGQNGEMKLAITAYHSLLQDYMQKLAHIGAIHWEGHYVPFAVGR